MAGKDKGEKRSPAAASFVAAGEFEGDQRSTSSVGTSRSLGWGTFTTPDEGGETVVTAPGDLGNAATTTTTADDAAAAAVAGHGIARSGGEDSRNASEGEGSRGVVDASTTATRGDSAPVVPSDADQDKDPTGAASSSPSSLVQAVVAGAAAVADTVATSVLGKEEDDDATPADDMGDGENSSPAAATLPRGFPSQAPRSNIPSTDSKGTTNQTTMANVPHTPPPNSFVHPKVPDASTASDSAAAKKEQDAANQEDDVIEQDSKPDQRNSLVVPLATSLPNAKSHQKVEVADGDHADEIVSSSNDRQSNSGDKQVVREGGKDEDGAGVKSKNEGMAQAAKPGQDEAKTPEDVDASETSLARSLPFGLGAVATAMFGTPEPKDVPSPSREEGDREDESRSHGTTSLMVGGPGAAALVMSLGGFGAADQDAVGFDSSDTGSQPQNNYLPYGLGGTGRGLRGVEEPASVVDEEHGAVDRETRNLKGIAIAKDGPSNAESESDEERFRRRLICWVVICCLLIVLIILLVIFLRDDDDEDRGIVFVEDDSTAVPTLSPTLTVLPTLAPIFQPTLAPVTPLVPTAQLEGEILDDVFGSSISFSGDGTVMAIGALTGWEVYDSGDGPTDWIPRDGPDPGRRLEHLREMQARNGGSLVALNSNGDTVFIADLGGTRLRVLRWNGSVWERVGNEVTEFTLSSMVRSLSVSGNGMTSAVGGEGTVQMFHYFPGADRHFPRGEVLGHDSVGAYVALNLDGKRMATSSSMDGEVSAFEWEFSGNVWIPLGAPIPATGSAIDAIVMSSLGTIVAFASGGSVYVYELVADEWAMLGSPFSGNDLSFGTALAMSGDASFIVVGANESDERGENAGEVRFYSFADGEWYMSYPPSYGAQAGDRWGTAVSISRDGLTIAISADQKDKQATGYVGVFHRVP